jgi:hypothetical protein
MHGGAIAAKVIIFQVRPRCPSSLALVIREKSPYINTHLSTLNTLTLQPLTLLFSHKVAICTLIGPFCPLGILLPTPDLFISSSTKCSSLGTPFSPGLSCPHLLPSLGNTNIRVVSLRLGPVPITALHRKAPIPHDHRVARLLEPLSRIARRKTPPDASGLLGLAIREDPPACSGPNPAMTGVIDLALPITSRQSRGVSHIEDFTRRTSPLSPTGWGSLGGMHHPTVSFENGETAIMSRQWS